MSTRVRYALVVNGQPQSVTAFPDTPLLWVLRDRLKLTGTKFGCGAGMCGACTVHIDGRAAFSCQLTVAAVAGRRITTIEGLATERSHPVQQAWIAEQVPQCGYCQSGQIMRAAALLKETPRPTRAQIVATMSTNLCRCGSYRKIVAAVERAAKQA
jgi:isoquinoline 1-oxidoreductase alpha subunit